MRRSTPDPASFLPLTPATLHVLLALADGEQHGYAIMRAVNDDTSTSLVLGPGTLYGALKRLLESALVEETAGDVSADDADERRRYYRLTPLGLAVIGAELQRMHELVRIGRRKKLLVAATA